MHAHMHMRTGTRLYAHAYARIRTRLRMHTRARTHTWARMLTSSGVLTQTRLHTQTHIFLKFPIPSLIGRASIPHTNTECGGLNALIFTLRHKYPPRRRFEGDFNSSCLASLILKFLP